MKFLLNRIIIILFDIVDIVRIILFSRLANIFNFTLCHSPETDLVRLANILLIFRTGLIEKSGLGGFNTALGIIQGDKSLFVGNILAITKSSCTEN